MRARAAIPSVLLLLTCGCVAPRWPAPGAASAPDMLRRGDEAGARRLLERAADGSDEALFRLALLQLREEDAAATERSLAELRRRFPASPWTAQAAPLEAYLQRVRRQAKSLKDANAALSRENRELRETIDKLKALDIRLGKGPR